jgi:hypothetical protein
MTTVPLRIVRTILTNLFTLNPVLLSIVLPIARAAMTTVR